jgi:hypothetical protein
MNKLNPRLYRELQQEKKRQQLEHLYLLKSKLEALVSPVPTPILLQPDQVPLDPHVDPEDYLLMSDMNRLG